MYSYTFSDKDTNQISERTSALSELEKKFATIDEKYNLTATVNPEDYQDRLSLERLQFEGKTSEQIEQQAKDALASYENSSKQAIQTEYQTKQQALEQDLQDLDKSTQESKKNLEQAYESVKKQASDDAIKRGLARSSIIANRLAQFDNQLLEQFAKIEKDYLEQGQKLTAQKNLLEVQRQNALSAFDIAYAVKLSEKINQITEEQQKKQKEVIEYNNKMEQLEKEYEQKMLEKLASAQSKAQQTNKAYLEYLSKYGPARIETAKTEEKYAAALEYLNTLPKAQALFELENNNMFKTQLKSAYSTLLSQIKARKE